MEKTNQSAKKILIADDDLAICDALKMMLEEEGYTVHTTVDGQFVYQLDTVDPDLVLLDIWMSGTDGREICRTLKQQDPTKQIPVIMISASQDVAESALAAGADDFIAKPFSMDELLNKVSKHIS